jgi:hypothetical protein
MTHTIFRALLFVCLAFPWAAHAEGFTVADLEADCMKCSEDLKTGSKSHECAFCDGTVTGVASTLIMLEGQKTVCPPKDLDTHRARNMFRLWVKNHQEHLDKPAVWGVVEATRDAYHCGEY